MKVTQFVNLVGVEHKQNNKWNPIRAIDDQIKADCSLKTLTKLTGLMAFLYSIWCECVVCRSRLAQNERETIFIWMCCVATAKFCKRHTNNFASPWCMRERLPRSWRLARALLSKQQRASWCGLSFPLSWTRFSTGVRGVWEKQCEREERKCVFISVGGAWFPLWSVCRPAPGPPCGRQKP